MNDIMIFLSYWGQPWVRAGLKDNPQKTLQDAIYQFGNLEVIGHGEIRNKLTGETKKLF